MIEYVEVTEVEALDDHRIRLKFSNGRAGIRDLADVLAEGVERYGTWVASKPSRFLANSIDICCTDPVPIDA
jgi:hypothetical protein